MTLEYWTFITDIRRCDKPVMFWDLYSVASTEKEAKQHITDKLKNNPFLLGRVEPAWI